MEITLVSMLYKTEGQMCICLLPLRNHVFWMDIKHQFLFLCFSPVANYYKELLKKKKKADEVYILLDFTSREACQLVVDSINYEISSREEYS